MDENFYLIRFKTTKGYLLQLSYLTFHKFHPYKVIRKINFSAEWKNWLLPLCNDHNNHKNDESYQEALLKANGLEF